MTFICTPCDTEDTKVCSKCGVEKLRTDFYPRKKGSHLVSAACKPCSLQINRDCHERYKDARNKRSNSWRKRNPDKAKAASRRSKLKSSYGITSDDYDRMLDEQNSVCAICNQPCSSGRRLAVDHNHDTGEVRGLLCHHCNKSLGGFKDSPELLLRAVAYLKEYSG